MNTMISSTWDSVTNSGAPNNIEAMIMGVGGRIAPKRVGLSCHSQVISHVSFTSDSLRVGGWVEPSIHLKNMMEVKLDGLNLPKDRIKHNNIFGHFFKSLVSFFRLLLFVCLGTLYGVNG